MKPIGLVFGGGGGKGAFEIGVWKYLKEIGLDNNIKAVSGTSVGALNAALFIGADYYKAENLWLNISQKMILTIDEDKIRKKMMLGYLGLAGIAGGIIVNPVIGAGIGVGMLGASATAQHAFKSALGTGVLTLFMKTVKNDYFFSRDGLITLINIGIDFSKLHGSKKPCFATCLRVDDIKYPKGLIERFDLRMYSDSEIVDLLLASSAIPFVFPKQKFRNKKYYDGGCDSLGSFFSGDNVPIQPIYEMNIPYIIVVNLSQNFDIKKQRFEHVNIIEIKPSADLGNLVSGTLDFSAEGSRKRIDQGYLDAKKVLEPMKNLFR